MSNIYIQEPPTSGKVLLKTSVGDIDIELWCKETPKACRNFIQLCMEGYYDGTIFHRIVKGFIAQGGDPNGDGTGGESIYGEPFKDEFHSRLRFTRRGLVASANSGRDDNGSQFFFTLGEATELQNKHTIFGKVAGDTIYNMLKLEEGVIDQNERPLYPHKIIKTEILVNPFDDIEPRNTNQNESSDKSKKKRKEKGVKNFGLLSFGEEAEEDEEETDSFVKSTARKSKSTHDVLDDPLLSKKTGLVENSENTDDVIEQAATSTESKLALDKKTELIRNKLKERSKPDVRSEALDPSEEESNKKVEETKSDSDEDYSDTLEKMRKKKRRVEAAKIRDEIKALKKDYKNERKVNDDKAEKDAKQIETKDHENELVQQYISEQRKYSHLKKDVPKKGTQREQQTLELLNKFKVKLENARKAVANDSEKSTDNSKQKNFNDDDDDDDEHLNDDTWLSHTLQFESQGEILAKDASTKKDDWYDVCDPRNPLNKRKRGEEDPNSK